MDVLSLLILLVIVGICSALAELIVGYSAGDLPRTVVIGVVGGFAGNMIGRALGGVSGNVLYDLLLIKVGTMTFSLVWTVVGCAIVLLLLSLMRGGRRWRILNRG